MDFGFQKNQIKIRNCVFFRLDKVINRVIKISDFAAGVKVPRPSSRVASFTYDDADNLRVF